MFSYTGRADSGGSEILCELQQQGDSLSCNLGNPFLNRTETLQFKFVPVYSAEMPADVMFTANLSTSSENLVTSLTNSRLVQLVRRAEVSLRGSVRPEAVLYGGQVNSLLPACDAAELQYKSVTNVGCPH